MRATSGQEGSVAAAIKAAENTKTIVMADSADLRPGDIDTQIYGRHAGLMDSHQRIRPGVLSAHNKGVLFDASHGNEGLWFRIAAPAIRHGFLPDTISTGMDSRSIMLPRANMTNVLSKFLAMGLTLEQVIERQRPIRQRHSSVQMLVRWRKAAWPTSLFLSCGKDPLDLSIRGMHE